MDFITLKHDLYQGYKNLLFIKTAFQNDFIRQNERREVICKGVLSLLRFYEK